VQRLKQARLGFKKPDKLGQLLNKVKFYLLK